MVRIKQPPRLVDSQIPYPSPQYPITSDNPLGYDDNLQYYPPDGEPPQPASHYRGRPNAGFLYPSPDIYRIRWPIFGDLSDIMIIDDPTDAHSEARPFQLPDGSLHTIADAAISEPACSSIEMHLDCLDYFSFETCDDCADDCERSWKEEEQLGEHCTCGSFYHPPKHKNVFGKPERNVVTIGDIILTLSPYFNSLKDDILRAGSRHLPFDSPLRLETQFFVKPKSLVGSGIRIFQDEGEKFTQWEWDITANQASRSKITPR